MPSELSSDGIEALMRPWSPRLIKTLPAKIFTSLAAPTVTVTGTMEFGRVNAGVAAQLREVHTERTALANDLEARPVCTQP